MILNKQYDRGDQLLPQMLSNSHGPIAADSMKTTRTDWKVFELMRRIQLAGTLFLLAAMTLTGCAKTPETDAPISATEQEELNDQLQEIEKMEQQNR